MSEQVKSIMKDIDESKINKLEKLYVPSFQIGIESQEIDTSQSTIEASSEPGSLQIKGGCMSCDIEMISGLPN